ncbi:hypothetical protein ACFL3S_00555 [Gemmatimonadota bacterium]
MSEKTESRTTFCTHCQKEVDVVLRPPASRDGHAVLPDNEQLVCLDFGGECDGEVCPISRLRPVVMGIRLARSGLRDSWKTVLAQCEGCGQVSELEFVDLDHAFCTLCGTTNTWMILELDNEGKVVITGRKEG